MLKFVLLTVFVVTCCAQKAKLAVEFAKIPICLAKAPEEPELTNSDQMENNAPLTEAEALKLYIAPVQESISLSKVNRDAVIEDTGAALARANLKDVTGEIISKPYNSGCPKLSNTYGAQDLCPSKRQLLTNFYSTTGNGYCYVLYPFWKKIYKTQCLCRECRTGCKPGYGYRNYCTPENYKYVKVWSICRRKGLFGIYYWKFSVEKVRIPAGNCKCKHYKTCF